MRPIAISQLNLGVCISILIATSLGNHIRVDEGVSDDVYCEDIATFAGLIENSFFEAHEVETSDHYLVKVFRVQNKPSEVFHNLSASKKTVLLIHGVLDSADEFVLGEQSIVSALLERDYDVWLLNSRGNKYSCANTQISPKSPEFWDYSFEGMADGDFKSTLEFIYEKKKEKVIVIGHSQGTTQVFAGLSSFPELQDKVDKFMALAPVVHMTGFDPGNWYYFGSTHNFLQVAKSLGYYKLLERPLNTNWFNDSLIRLFCSSIHWVCDFIISKMTDRDPNMIDTKNMNNYLKHNPSRTNIKSLEHFSQMIANYKGGLSRFDYGEEENKNRYGTPEPPLYDLSVIRTRVYMYYGDNDLLSTLENAELLKKELKSVTGRIYPDWGHLSFFLGKERQVFVQHLLEDIDESS
jgi:pimeloyl-ACP methyl ester carboxylesterase